MNLLYGHLNTSGVEDISGPDGSKAPHADGCRNLAGALADSHDDARRQRRLWLRSTTGSRQPG
jgi:hypothetical protein